MAKKTGSIGRSSTDMLPPLLGSDSPILKEFKEHQALFDAQPATVRHFLEAQARKLAEASRRNQLQTTFMLPDRVVVEIPADGKGALVAIPEGMREQVVGSMINRLTRADMRTVLRQRLKDSLRVGWVFNVK